MDGGAWKAAVHGVEESRTWLSNFTFTHWKRKWQPTPVFLPGQSQGWGSLLGCRLWGRTDLDMTEVTSLHFTSLPLHGPTCLTQTHALCRCYSVTKSCPTLCDPHNRSTPGSSVLPMNIQGWFPLGLTGLISLLSKGLSRVFSSTTVRKHQFFGTQPSLWWKGWVMLLNSFPMWCSSFHCQSQY